VTGDSRRYIREQQYKTDANLAARQAIYAYQEPRVDLARRALALAELEGDESVLDIGCGNGVYLGALAGTGHRGLVAGMDLSPGMLDAAGARAWDARLMIGDAQSVPFVDGAFGVTLAMHMLYHVPDRALAIRELRRVTRSGGVALVVTNSEHHLQEIHDVVFAAAGRSLPSHRLSFKIETGEPELRAGFASVEPHLFESRLNVPEVEPVLDYVRSMKAFVASDDLEPVLDDIRARVQTEIDRDGVFRVRTGVGCFVCR
jgi:SAM-dependent methyltransferase